MMATSRDRTGFRLGFRRVTALVATIVVCVLGCAPAPPPPNIVLWVVDTLRADALSAYGHEIVPTPRLEEFAAQGTLFENAMAQSSWTRASMASMLTGLYAETLDVRGRGHSLPDRAAVLSESLQEHGYRTAFIATNPNIGSFYGFDQGYDSFIEMYERRETGAVRQHELIAEAEEVVDEALQWIDSAGSEKPFFLGVLTNDPHAPYNPPEAFDLYRDIYQGELSQKYGQSENRLRMTRGKMESRYMGEVAYSDHAFGSFIDALDSRGLRDNTIIVFTADHGEEFWEVDVHGHGKNLRQGVLHIPLIVRYPPQVPAGVRVERIAQTIDIQPTLLSLAGLPIPDGSDGSPLFDDDTDPDQSAVSLLALGKTRLYSVREGSYKLVRDEVAGAEELYDLETEMGEAFDVSAKFPEIKTRLSRVIGAYKEDIEARKAARIAAGETEAEPIPDEDIPDNERALLEVLGYIEEKTAEEGEGTGP